MPDLDAARRRLEAVGQDHVLKYADELTDSGRAALLAQVDALDLEALPGLIDKYVHSDAHFEVPDEVEPAPYYPRDPASPVKPWDAAAARKAGDELIAAGKVACFTVAGGQGTRLGYNGPKGCYPTSCVTEKSLFELFAEQVLATARTYDTIVPWYIMTSPLNHEGTVGFFEEHDFFGLDRENVAFFQQGVMPSIDKHTGKLLLADRGAIATNPDGHGGALLALFKSGAIDDMKSRGVEHVSYFQVDNPNVRIVDPVFLGLHAAAEDSSGEMSSKMVAKAAATEKVGNFTRVGGDGGRTAVIEYSDLPEELAKQTDESGNLRFIAGSIAIHAIGVAFVDRIINDPSMALPFHRAIKKVPYFDLSTGSPVAPTEPNAVKLEKFIFDAIPMAEKSIVFETDRVEEFAPVKNAEGTDSIVTSKQLQSERAARWLEGAGVSVPRKPDGTVDAVIELSPLTALSAEQLRERSDLPEKIAAGASVTL